MSFSLVFILDLSVILKIKLLFVPSLIMYVVSHCSLLINLFIAGFVWMPESSVLNLKSFILFEIIPGSVCSHESLVILKLVLICIAKCLLDYMFICPL